MSLFGPPPTQPKKKLEFRAGKMYRDGATKWVKPDTRKGLVYMDVGDDSLLHFFWKDRTTNKVEEDLIIFPDEAEFIKVTQAKEKDRVYMLRFKSSSQKHFFWMQEPKNDKDEEHATKINSAINDPSTLSSSPGAEMNPEQEQLLRLLQQTASMGQGPPASSSSRPAASAAREQPAAGQPSAADLETLRNLLSGIQVPQDASAADDLDLSSVLTLDNVRPILQNPASRQALFPHLPEGVPQTTEELEQTIRSPQFQQSLQTLTYALRSGSLSAILAQLGLTSSPGTQETVRAFLNAIAKQVKKDGNGSGSGSGSGDAMDTS